MSLAEELSEALPGLKNWASKFAGPHYDADDLITDTIIDLLEHPWKWDPERGPVRNLIFSMIRNRSMDAKRSYNRKYQQRFRQYLRNEAPLFLVTSPSREAEERDWKGEVERGLSEIPRRCAEAFRLFAFEGKSIEEVAQSMAISKVNARNMIYRARQKLQSYLKSA